MWWSGGRSEDCPAPLRPSVAAAARQPLSLLLSVAERERERERGGGGLTRLR